MIGVDFDNTIACYDDVFGPAAIAHGWVPEGSRWSKGALRDHLRAADREDDWTELQGIIYGPEIRRAAPFPGVTDFFRTAIAGGRDVAIVSHKTRYPYRGDKHDLHAAARGWIKAQGFHQPTIGLPPERVFLEVTREDKYARIATLGCRFFVDDLPEFLGDADFPQGVERILFDPHDRLDDDARFRRFTSWSEIGNYVLSAA
jgi:hypothetical protein